MSVNSSVVHFEALNKILSTLSSDYMADVENRHQNIVLGRLDKHLKEMGTVTVIIEHDYVDRHFIEDYCGHFGRCFHDYVKKCVRLHFFTGDFDDDVLKAVVIEYNENKDAILALGDYVGHIVLRPLPLALLGRVCLKMKPDSEDFHILRKNFETHFCGMTFHVDTIAFQEQDHAVSACATAALWAAFHAMPGNRSQDVPSPHKITSDARKVVTDGTHARIVDKGLSVAQMIGVIRNNGYDTVTSGYVTMSYTKALIRAYLNIGIPIILGAELYYRSDSDELPEVMREIGAHAVTVLGCDYNTKIKSFHTGVSDLKKDDAIADLYLESSGISSIYVHDDQIGPYSKMTFPDEYAMAMETEWESLKGGRTVDARITALLIPCDIKIRIGFDAILDIAMRLNFILSPQYKEWGIRISWDIKLESVCSLKNEIINLSAEEIDDELRYNLLSRPLPRFIWAIDMYSENINNPEGSKSKDASFYFDATDIEKADFLLCSVHYDEEGYILNKAIVTSYQRSHDLDSFPRAVKGLLQLYDKDKANRLIYPNM